MAPVDPIEKLRALATRFWRYVQKGEPDACWEWTAGRFDNRYGQFRVGKRKMKASRCAYILTKGEIASGLRVLHTCDNPPCCNPAHLFLGTDADNGADKAAKGRAPKGADNGAVLHPERMARGEENAAAKLTGDVVDEIRRQNRKGMSLGALAKQTGISKSQVANICRNRSWRHRNV